MGITPKDVWFIAFWCQRDSCGQRNCSQINYENTKFPLFSKHLSLLGTHRTVNIHCYWEVALGWNENLKIRKQLWGLGNEAKARRRLRVTLEKKAMLWQLECEIWWAQKEGRRVTGSTPVFLSTTWTVLHKMMVATSTQISQKEVKYTLEAGRKVILLPRQRMWPTCMPDLVFHGQQNSRVMKWEIQLS